MKNSNKTQPYHIDITDIAYKNGSISKVVLPLGTEAMVLDLTKNYGWYDFILSIKGYPSFLKRYAGRVEIGKESYSDPMMGGNII